MSKFNGFTQDDINKIAITNNKKQPGNIFEIKFTYSVYSSTKIKF